jgi:hypothetical protein
LSSKNEVMNVKITTTALMLAAVLLLGACASTGSRSSSKEEARGPSVLKPTPQETPAAVRAIENRIDSPSVILASEAFIEVSKNYEMEMSVSGDDVSNRDLDPSGGVLTLGKGKCTIFIRNLKIICDQGFRVQIADFGTNPFINVSARGHCSHIIPAGNGNEHDVKRAQGILIRNENIRYLENDSEVIAAFVGR